MVVEYNNQVRQLPVLVLNGSGPNLFGRNWLEKICLNWTSIKRLARPNLEEVLNKYDDLFTDELGKLNGVTAKIYVDPSTKPIFCKARSVEGSKDKELLNPYNIQNGQPQWYQL